MMIIRTLIIGLLVICTGCQGSSLHEPQKSHKGLLNADTEKETTVLTGLNKDVLLRYLAGSSQWSVRIVPNGYRAFMRIQSDGSCSQDSKSGFNQILPIDVDCSDIVAWCVLISINGDEELPRSNTAITRMKFGDKLRGISVSPPHGGMPGYSSWLLVKHDNFSCAIFEARKKKERLFTKIIYERVIEELRSVALHSDYLREYGILPGSRSTSEGDYAVISETPTRKDSYRDYGGYGGGQQMVYVAPKKDGINVSPYNGAYLLESQVNPQQNGITFAKVFNLDADRYVRVSSDIYRESARVVGWSGDCNVRFCYLSIVHIYDNPDIPFNARVELWYKNEDGKERILAINDVHVNGWDR